MPDKSRVMLSIDPKIYEWLQEVANTTDLSVAGIVTRLLSAHLYELDEYHEWLKAQTNPRLHMQGKNLLRSYGSESLIEGIRRLDPQYVFKFEQGGGSEVARHQ